MKAKSKNATYLFHKRHIFKTFMMILTYMQMEKSIYFLFTSPCSFKTFVSYPKKFQNQSRKFRGKRLLISPKSVCELSPLVTLTSMASGPAAAMEGQLSGWSSTVTVTPISCAIKGAFTRLMSELVISFSSPTRTAEPRNVFILDTPAPARRTRISRDRGFTLFCKSFVSARQGWA